MKDKDPNKRIKKLEKILFWEQKKIKKKNFYILR